MEKGLNPGCARLLSKKIESWLRQASFKED